ncbi:MAG TPA: response regulator transcription factor [Bryobacteraceae bacterium]|nr:response regulator transcription factor [Bryobacteraceae bacterium]
MRILLIEDEPSLVLTLTDLLIDQGYLVETAMDGPSGLEKAQSHHFDLVILDVMLPGKDGLQVCRELRASGNHVIVLMLTAKTQLADRVAGLKLGADDYLAKPFEPPELLARIEALLRRSDKQAPVRVSRFRFGEVEVDFEKGDVAKRGKRINLAGKELDLLRYLIDHRGTVVSRNDLLQTVWDYQPGVSSRTIDVHVAWLRQKLEDQPQNPRHIYTIRGVGYRFSP